MHTTSLPRGSSSASSAWRFRARSQERQGWLRLVQPLRNTLEPHLRHNPNLVYPEPCKESYMVAAPLYGSDYPSTFIYPHTLLTSLSSPCLENWRRIQKKPWRAAMTTIDTIQLPGPAHQRGCSRQSGSLRVNPRAREPVELLGKKQGGRVQRRAFKAPMSCDVGGSVQWRFKGKRPFGLHDCKTLPNHGKQGAS